MILSFLKIHMIEEEKNLKFGSSKWCESMVPVGI